VDLELKGRRALVTGGARGIGAAICRLLAAEGAEVYVGYRSSIDGPRLAAEIGGTAVQLDVADPESAHAAIEPLGTLDILVNNAGLDDMAFFTELTADRWRPQLAVNLEGVLNCTLATLPAMQAARYGRVVNVSSEAGRMGSKRGSVYAAAKGGVIAFTKSIAIENARYGITANSVLPGPIETPMLDANRRGPKGEQVVAAMSGATLLGRIGRPEEVAAAVAFLASDAASYITGESLGVSGGMGVAGSS
jgi:2-hydroxycyclohexanecarboxyl-CoA dehydrogenase